MNISEKDGQLLQQLNNLIFCQVALEAGCIVKQEDEIYTWFSGSPEAKEKAVKLLAEKWHLVGRVFLEQSRQTKIAILEQISLN